MADIAHTLFNKGCYIWQHAANGDNTAFFTAIGFIQRAIELEPDNAYWHAMLARLFVQVENEDEAREQIRIAFSLVPESFQAWFANYQLLALHNRNLLRDNALFGQTRVDWNLGKMDDSFRHMTKAFGTYCSQTDATPDTVLSQVEKLLVVADLQRRFDRSRFDLRNTYSTVIQNLKAFKTRIPQTNSQLEDYLAQAEGALAVLK